MSKNHLYLNIHLTVVIYNWKNKFVEGASEIPRTKKYLYHIRLILLGDNIWKLQ